MAVATGGDHDGGQRVATRRGLNLQAAPRADLERHAADGHGASVALVGHALAIGGHAGEDVVPTLPARDTVAPADLAPLADEGDDDPDGLAIGVPASHDGQVVLAEHGHHLIRGVTPHVLDERARGRGDRGAGRYGGAGRGHGGGGDGGQNDEEQSDAETHD